MSTRNRKCSKYEMQSKVLLVCVYDTIIFELSNQFIYSKFQKFGSINKILIFQKGQVTKFFIEYAENQQAQHAKNIMDGSKLYQNICKMNIYFSNFDNVNLKHTTSEGADFSHTQQEKKSFIQQYDLLSKSSYEQTIIQNSYFGFNDLGFTSTFRSKTDDPKILQSMLKMVNQNEQNQHQQINELDETIKSSIFSIIDSQNQTLPYSNKKSQEVLKLILGFHVENTISITNVYNFFSNFGNISSIMIKQNLILIKFKTEQFAAIALNYLNNYTFYGNFIHLKYYDENNFKQKQGEYSECKFFDQTFDRFVQKKSITINPPSETLHVSGIKKQICNVKSLCSIFEQVAKVDKISILKKSTQKNMALVKLYSLEQSFIAISALHNQVFNGRKMQLSFTKSKI